MLCFGCLARFWFLTCFVAQLGCFLQIHVRKAELRFPIPCCPLGHKTCSSWCLSAAVQDLSTLFRSESRFPRTDDVKAIVGRSCSQPGRLSDSELWNLSIAGLCHTGPTLLNSHSWLGCPAVYLSLEPSWVDMWRKTPHSLSSESIDNTFPVHRN